MPIFISIDIWYQVPWSPKFQSWAVYLSRNMEIFLSSQTSSNFIPKPKNFFWKGQDQDFFPWNTLHIIWLSTLWSLVDLSFKLYVREKKNQKHQFYLDFRPKSQNRPYLQFKKVEWKTLWQFFMSYGYLHFVPPFSQIRYFDRKRCVWFSVPLTVKYFESLNL